MIDPFLKAIVDRIRDVVSRHSGHELDLLAEMLGVAPSAFRALIERDDQTLNTTLIIDVVTAFVRQFAIDPRWVLTGQYNPTTHRQALILGDYRSASGAIALRELIGDHYVRLRDAMRGAKPLPH